MIKIFSGGWVRHTHTHTRVCLSLFCFVFCDTKPPEPLSPSQIHNACAPTKLRRGPSCGTRGTDAVETRAIPADLDGRVIIVDDDVVAGLADVDDGSGESWPGGTNGAWWTTTSFDPSSTFGSWRVVIPSDMSCRTMSSQLFPIMTACPSLIRRHSPRRTGWVSGRMSSAWPSAKKRIANADPTPTLSASVGMPEGGGSAGVSVVMVRATSVPVRMTDIAARTRIVATIPISIWDTRIGGFSCGGKNDILPLEAGAAHKQSRWFFFLDRADVNAHRPVFFPNFVSAKRSVFFNTHTHTHVRFERVGGVHQIRSR